MLNELRHKLALGLTLALAGAALGATGALAGPEAADATSDRQEAVVVVPPIWTEPWLQDVNESATFPSPDTGLNMRIPGFDSTIEQFDQDDAVIPESPESYEGGTFIVQSPATGRNARVPAF